MRALVLKALLAAGITVGCLFATACSGDLVVIDITGDWALLTEDNVPSCLIGPDHVFRGGDVSSETFSILQTGDQIWASGQDQFGNNYNMWGYMRGGRMDADWEVDLLNGRRIEIAAYTMLVNSLFNLDATKTRE